MTNHTTITWADLRPAPTIHLSNAINFATTNNYGIVDISDETIRWLGVCVTSLIRFTGDREITAVTTQDIDRWQKREITRGIKATTINSYLRGLKVLYSRMQKNGTIHNNPTKPIKPLSEDPPNPKAISRSDYELLRNAAVCSRDRAIIDTLWATGCRVGGLISMQIDHLEKWEINGETCYAVKVNEKGNKNLIVYWKGTPADCLTAWLQSRPFTTASAIFLTRNKKPFTRNGFSSLMRQVRLKTNVNGRPVNPHAFRHAFAIRKLNEGYDIATVSQWLGHSSPEFTAKIYCIRSESELRERYFSNP